MNTIIVDYTQIHEGFVIYLYDHLTISEVDAIMSERPKGSDVAYALWGGIPIAVAHNSPEFGESSLRILSNILQDTFSEELLGFTSIVIIDVNSNFDVN